MRLHLLKYTMPAALVSAVVAALTWGASIAQAAAVRVPDGNSTGALPTNQPVTGAWLVVSLTAIVALSIGGLVYAVIADRHRRTRAPAASVGRLERLPGRIEPEQARKAA
jgi:hypothetical protein